MGKMKADLTQDSSCVTPMFLEMYTVIPCGVWLII